MLSPRLYEIGKKLNLITKYNIEYNKLDMLNYACAFHVNELLEERYKLTSELKSKLSVILNNLIVL